MESWLATLRDFETTEPRDKYWIACLLARHDPPLVEGPQYWWSLKDTYVFIVRYLLIFHNSLRVLEYCSTTLNLPSWVPDWRAPLTRPLSAWDDVRFRATRNSETHFEISGNQYLHLKGFCFDRVQRCPHFKIGLLQDIIGREAGVIGNTYISTGESIKKALIRVAHADHSSIIQDAYEWMTASNEERQRLARPSHYISELSDEIDFAQSGLLGDWIASNTEAMSGRKYFISNNLSIGLIPEYSQEGDMICIFMGGKTPFVVRPKGEHHQMIGACYVHGIMYGEAMNDFEEQGRDFQDFSLV